MARIRIGTCSWTDKPLVESGAFYPAEAKSAEAMLRYYASQFGLVEVDSIATTPSPNREMPSSGRSGRLMTSCSI